MPTFVSLSLSLCDRMAGLTGVRGLQGVENVYTQHTPLLARILELVLKTKTKDRDLLYPMIENNPRDRCGPSQ